MGIKLLTSFSWKIATYRAVHGMQIMHVKIGQAEANWPEELLVQRCPSWKDEAKGSVEGEEDER
jgi:hypothetical protein